jgi:hypothetical protein
MHKHIDETQKSDKDNLPRIHIETLFGKLSRNDCPPRELTTSKCLDSLLRRLYVLIFDVNLANAKIDAGSGRTRDFGLENGSVLAALLFNIFLDFWTDVSTMSNSWGDCHCLPSYSSSLSNSSEVTMFIRQTTRLCSRFSAALAPASMEMAPTPPSRPVVCWRPTVARDTLRLPSPSGMSFKPSMTASIISLSAYSQKAMPCSMLAS